jgi:hypothetical protein
VTAFPSPRSRREKDVLGALISLDRPNKSEALSQSVIGLAGIAPFRPLAERIDSKNGQSACLASP